MIDYEKLQKSLKHLELQFANYQSAKDRKELVEIDREAIAESVIQRFETCYDTLSRSNIWNCNLPITSPRRIVRNLLRLTAKPSRNPSSSVSRPVTIRCGKTSNAISLKKSAWPMFPTAPSRSSNWPARTTCLPPRWSNG